jgi:circadian clock protein KaiC
MWIALALVQSSSHSLEDCFSARTSTGIVGFDEMIGGGFPPGRVILLLGEPGAGKTIFCSQFLLNGFKKFGERGIFVSMDETKDQFVREMQVFGWDFSSAEKEGCFRFIDASPLRSVPQDVKVGMLDIGKQDFTLISLLAVLRDNVEKWGAIRIVLDPMSLWLSLYPDDAERRRALIALVRSLSETRATCLLSSELRHVGIIGRSLQVEEYLTHGVVLMQTVPIGRTMVRTIQVEKMRETQIDRQPRPYQITENGIEVYPTESVI